VTAGMLWMKFSPVTMFLFSAGGAFAVALFFSFLSVKNSAKEKA